MCARDGRGRDRSGARGRAHVCAVDVFFRAVLCVRLNARLNGVRVEALRGDLLGAVPGRRFDVITQPALPAE